MKRRTISLLFLSVLCWEDPRGWWGNKPDIRVDFKGSCSDLGIFPCSRWNYSYLLRSALCGWWSVPGETHPRHHLGLVLLSPSRVWLILIITMEPNSPKKIQFAVPLFQSQIAPEAAEQVSRIGWGPVVGCKVTWTYILVINWRLLYLLNLPNFVDFQDTWMRNKLASICTCIWVALCELLVKMQRFMWCKISIC